MPDTVWYPMAGALQNATERQAVYANSVYHLFQSSFTPTPSDPLASYTAAEADYTTYASFTATAWNTPILAPNSGYLIEGPFKQFNTGTSDPAVTNVIRGVYLVDSGGELRMTVVFGDLVPMEVANQGCPVQLIDVFPTGA